VNWIQKTHHKQENQVSCVPASLAMVLSVYGIQISQSELRGQMGITPRGTQISDEALDNIRLSQWDLQHQLQYDCTLDDLKTDIANGNPPIVVIRSSYLPHAEDDLLHAVVAIGVDEQQIYLNDPLREETTPVQMRLDLFMEAWEWNYYCAVRIKPSSTAESA
jgi:ABC-type bacteriocin/lantibiotic exporter with double-glycine peptidase domain